MRAPGAAVDACSGHPVPATEQDGVVLLRCTSHMRPPLSRSTIRPIRACPGADCVESAEIASQASAIRVAGVRPKWLPASGADTPCGVHRPVLGSSYPRRLPPPCGPASGLVTVAQGSYSFRLLDSLRYKVRGPAFPKTPRAAIGCVRNRRAKSRVARILFAEAMNTNTFAICHAELRTASSVRAPWRCA